METQTATAPDVSRQPDVSQQPDADDLAVHACAASVVTNRSAQAFARVRTRPI